MASAERLLHDAQYEFASISFDNSRANRRRAARAASLCRKIVRRYPASMEAQEARAILRRLGDESYDSTMPWQPLHTTQAPEPTGHEARATARPVSPAVGSPAFDWGGLVAVILMTPKIVLGILGALAFALYALAGPLVLVALLALIVLTGPFRSVLSPAQRRQVDAFIVRANALIDERRRSGTGLA